MGTAGSRPCAAHSCGSGLVIRPTSRTRALRRKIGVFSSLAPVLRIAGGLFVVAGVPTYVDPHWCPPVMRRPSRVLYYQKSTISSNSTISTDAKIIPTQCYHKLLSKKVWFSAFSSMQSVGPPLDFYFPALFPRLCGLRVSVRAFLVLFPSFLPVLWRWRFFCRELFTRLHNRCVVALVNCRGSRAVFGWSQIKISFITHRERPVCSLSYEFFVRKCWCFC